MTDALLTVNGRIYDGWTDVRIRRGIDQISGAFALTVSERRPSSTSARPIKRGDKCSVAVEGTTLITGYVDDVLVQYDSRQHSLQIIGRDATGDLVDCSAMNLPGRWENRNLVQIAQALCKPFGIKVCAEVGTGDNFRAFALQPGETVFEAIERMCRLRGVLPVSNGLGALLITRAGSSKVPVRLVQGENILAAAGQLSWRQRHSFYVVKGQDSGFDQSTPEQNSGPKGEATDPGVTRYRPLMIVSENPANSAQLKERALWEASVRRGRSAVARITVQGWQHVKGLWQPNQLVGVTSEWLQLEGDLLIYAVTMIKDGDGTRTDLEVCSPSAFELMELAEEEDLWSA